jgi:uncharacterized protein with PQ loop repeat
MKLPKCLKNISPHVLSTLAIILGLISFLPLIYRIYDTKDTDNFPINTLLLLILSNLLWIIYGIIEKDKSICGMGLIYFFIYIYILFVKETH